MKKRRIKSCLLITLLPIVLLSILVFVGLFIGNKRIISESYKNNVVSFYYRDTLSLDNAFPQYADYDVSLDTVSGNVILSGRNLYFKEPETLQVPDLVIPIIFRMDEEVKQQQVHVRCWKDNVFALQEYTDHPLYEASKLKLYIDAIKIHLGDNSFSTVVGLNDTLFSTIGGKMCMQYNGGTENCGDLLLESPKFNQVMGGG